jgi:hypothetical protein
MFLASRPQRAAPRARVACGMGESGAILDPMTVALTSVVTGLLLGR